MKTALPTACLLFLAGFVGVASDSNRRHSFTQERITIAIPDAEGARRQDVEVPVVVAGAQDLGCLQMALLYDPALLEVRTVIPGSLLPARAILVHDKTIPGRLGMGFLSGPNTLENGLNRIHGDGVLFNVRYTVVGRAGQQTRLTPHRAQAWLETNEEIVVDTEDGVFTISGYPWIYCLLGVIGLGIILSAVLWNRRRKIPLNQRGSD